MANNRMLLVHVPTGLAAFIGKRMGLGWYTADGQNVHDDVGMLFSVLDKDYGDYEDQDNFAIVMEDVDLAPHALGEWQYISMRPDGLWQLELSSLYKPEETP